MVGYYITAKEKDAIRFYGGDVRKREEDGHLSDTECREGFYGIKSAYKTMNCLFFPGIINERVRIDEGTARMVPQIIEEAEKAAEVFCDIYRAMCKFALSQKGKKNLKVYRTERGVSAEELKKGNLVSFTSTSFQEDAEEFLKKKKELTLLEFIVPCSVPHVDYQEVLGDEYLYSQQQEVLLPPFLDIEMYEMKSYPGEDGGPGAGGEARPGKYLIQVKEKRKPFGEQVCKSAEETDVFSDIRKKEAAAVLEKMNKGEALTAQEEKQYCLWKEGFQTFIKQKIQQIDEEYFDGADKDLRKEMLRTDVRKMLFAAKDKRKEYQRKLFLCNLVLILAGVLPIVCVSLSFWDKFETEMKICAVIASAVAIFLSRIIKIEAYGAKLVQRTKTYLALCDLDREMKYERAWSEERVDEYVEKFRTLMKEDTEMSLQNLRLQIESGEALFQDEIEV